MIQLLGILVVALLLYLGQKTIYQKVWHKNLRVRLSFQEEGIWEGQESTLSEIIENQKKLPLTMLKVKFQTDRHLLFADTKGSRTTDKFYRNDIFQIGALEKVTRVLRFTAGRRGYYTIAEADLVASDLFLTAQYTATADIGHSSLYVYPKPFSHPEFRQSLKQLSGQVLTKRHLQEDPFEYRGIREYQPQDDLKSINWKATARTGEFKVNQKNYTAEKSVRIFINLEDTGILKKEDCVEASLQIATALLLLFLEQGMQVAVYCNGVDVLHNEPCILEAGGGIRQREAVLRAFALIDTSKPVRSFTELFSSRLSESSGALMTCIVSPNAYDDFASLILQYHTRHPDMKWFLPYSGTVPPEMEEELRSLITFISLREESV
ncbi:DUF58 domain-containing protein [Simiaoa sp.]|uniref:DUF58 domain-containing protein n=1 Tax=Simiaoa sp. TaxID=2944202 RepID=UPI003F7F19DB